MAMRMRFTSCRSFQRNYPHFTAAGSLKYENTWNKRKRYRKTISEICFTHIMYFAICICSLLLALLRLKRSLPCVGFRLQSESAEAVVTKCACHLVRIHSEKIVFRELQTVFSSSLSQRYAYSVTCKNVLFRRPRLVYIRA